MKKKMKKILSWIFISILIFMAIIIVVVFIQTKINPEKIPSIFGYKPFIFLANSIEPEIYNGDLVIVKNVDVKTLKNNDIIAFKDSENYVVISRIIKIIEDGNIKFITKDNASTFVNESDVEGIYQFKIKKLGNILLIMQKPATLILSLILIVGGGALYITFDNEKLANDKNEPSDD